MENLAGTTLRIACAQLASAHFRDRRAALRWFRAIGRSSHPTPSLRTRVRIFRPFRTDFPCAHRMPWGRRSQRGVELSTQWQDKLGTILMKVLCAYIWTRRIKGALLALFLSAWGSAHAAEPCVSTSAGLKNALIDAKNHAAGYTIRIVASPMPYQLGSATQFVTMPPHAVIRGGYTANCASYDDFADAAATVIDFGGYQFNLGPDPAYYGYAEDLKIENLTLQHGGDFFAKAGWVGDFSDDMGQIFVQNVRFTDFRGNQQLALSPVEFHAVKGLTQLVNVQFDHLQPAGACQVTIDGENDSTFNANFITADLSDGMDNKDFCLSASDQSGTLTARIDNSIIWGSSPSGTSEILGVDRSGHHHPIKFSTYYSIFTQFSGWGTVTEEFEHVTADPQWANPTASDYHLGPSSPAINAGYTGGSLGAPYYDIEHSLRGVGSHPDRGAYESLFDDSPTLTVTSAADSGAHTLRAAIDSANLFGGTHTIKFNLPACPTVISLATPLPDIKSAITIDGYSQSGAAPNDSDLSFDANLCVIVKPASNATTAFRVPTDANGGSNATLNLLGLGIGGFGQDVVLLGGANHSISGNQFGGTANGVDLGISSLSVISVGVDAYSFAIGGYGSQNRNVILGASGTFGYGINIQGTIASDPEHCRIVNNWIGLAPDLTPLPNEYGVMLSGSGCAVYDNRIVSSMYGNLWIDGGHDNVVQRNIIGDPAAANSAFGIRIDGDNNTVGTPATGTVQGTLLTNDVTDMDHGGIVVASGIGNSIRGNYIAWNGTSTQDDGNGMDIDLGGDGPTANGSDAPPGPNNWQPFPVVDHVYTPPGGAPTIVGHLAAVPGTYAVDAYYSGACSNVTVRAHAEAHLGDTSVTIPAGASSASFTLHVPLPSDAGYVGFTATSVSNGTSELGTCARFDMDHIFSNSFGFNAERGW
jgi:hypothetical protein